MVDLFFVLLSWVFASNLNEEMDERKRQITRPNNINKSEEDERKDNLLLLFLSVQNQWYGRIKSFFMSFNNIQLSSFCHSNNNHITNMKNDTNREKSIFYYRHLISMEAFEDITKNHRQTLPFDDQNESKDLLISQSSIFSLTYLLISLWGEICSNESQSNTQAK